MSKDNLKFVIVGHVDHGKSTLIGRLLYDTNSLPSEKVDEIREICEALGKDMEFGYVMDHLEEERDQGITIETAQTFFSTDERDYVIIDAPGHVEFLKNMITGASQAEAAILIVDAEEGIKEQTKRHAYILSMLGLKQVIAVINKMDLVDNDREHFDMVKKDLLDFLGNLSINPTHVIPISAKKGDNIAGKSERMPWYKGPTILEALASFRPRESPKEKGTRFVVQDVYNFDKRIIVGRVESGILREGDPITILPSGEKTIVKSLEEFGGEPTEAAAGKCIGFTTEDKLFIDRGNVIINNGTAPNVTDEFRANIFWMDPAPYKGGPLWFRLATQEVPCEIEEIEKIIDSSTLQPIDREDGTIQNREVASVRLRTTKPVVMESFYEIEELGRFVLQQDDTLAGGIITGKEE